MGHQPPERPANPVRGLALDTTPRRIRSSKCALAPVWAIGLFWPSTRRWGPKLEGLKSACRMFQNNGAMERAKGSGSKHTRRAPETVESVWQYMEGNPRASCGDAASAFNLTKTAMRMVLTEDLDTRPLRKVTAQRAQPDNAQKRLGTCKIRDEKLDSGELGVEKIFFTEEMSLRLGACSGGVRISSRT